MRERVREGDRERESKEEEGVFSEKQEGSWLVHSCVGGNELRSPCSPSIKRAIMKKCAMLKVQKQKPNHSNLQIILIWWWLDSPETNHGKGQF